MFIKVVVGPGEKSGITKTSVGTPDSHLGWPMRHYTHPDRAEARIAELVSLGGPPDPPVTRIPRG